MHATSIASTPPFGGTSVSPGGHSDSVDPSEEMDGAFGAAVTLAIGEPFDRRLPSASAAGDGLVDEPAVSPDVAADVRDALDPAWAVHAPECLLSEPIVVPLRFASGIDASASIDLEGLDGTSDAEIAAAPGFSVDRAVESSRRKHHAGGSWWSDGVSSGPVDPAEAEPADGPVATEPAQAAQLVAVVPPMPVATANDLVAVDNERDAAAEGTLGSEAAVDADLIQIRTSESRGGEATAHGFRPVRDELAHRPLSVELDSSGSESASGAADVGSGSPLGNEEWVATLGPPARGHADAQAQTDAESETNAVLHTTFDERVRTTGPSQEIAPKAKRDDIADAVVQGAGSSTTTIPIVREGPGRSRPATGAVAPRRATVQESSADLPQSSVDGHLPTRAERPPSFAARALLRTLLESSPRAQVDDVSHPAPALGEAPPPEQASLVASADGAARVGAIALDALALDVTSDGPFDARSGHARANDALPGHAPSASPSGAPGELRDVVPATVVSGVPVREVLVSNPRLSGAPGQVEDVVLPQIVQAMRVQVRQGVSEASMQLDPEHLGAVTVTLRVEHGQVSATIAAEAPEVRRWLDGHQSVLRAALAEQGLELHRFVVNPDGGSSQHRHQGAEEPPRRRPGLRAADRGTARFEVVV